MDDFKLNIEVKVTVKPVHPQLAGEVATPYERNMFIVRESKTALYHGLKTDIAGFVADAVPVLSRQWALSANEPPQCILEDPDAYGVTATFRGKVNAHGVSTVVTFEYGLTKDLGTSSAADQSPATNSYWIDVTQGVSGLTAETYYYARMKCVSDGVTVYSNIKKFKTAAAGVTSTSTTSTTSTTTTTT